MGFNRMWLVNHKTGQKVLLGQYDGSLGGWNCFHWDLQDRLDKMFSESRGPITTHGDNDWSIKYDHEIKGSD